MAAIFSAGSINADMVFNVRAVTGAGETQLAKALLRLSGGKAANRAVQATRLGAHARLFGAVGDDGLAPQALAGPKSAGVDLSGVVVAPQPTGVAAILVDEQGQKSITLAANANEAWPEWYAGWLSEAVVDSSDRSVLCCDLEGSTGALERVLQEAAGRRIPIVIDPSPPDRVDPALLCLGGHITPNADEATRLTGVAVESPESALTAAGEIVARGAGAAYVKLRGGGCVVVVRDEADAIVIEPPVVPVVDATGAGDAFAGALAVALADGRSPGEAAQLAVAASAWAVGRQGSQESYARPHDLEAMAKRITRRTAAAVHG